MPVDNWAFFHTPSPDYQEVVRKGPYAELNSMIARGCPKSASPAGVELNVAFYVTAMFDGPSVFLNLS